jgi:hypothetical protein
VTVETKLEGTIENVPLLDLTGLGSRDELNAITGLRNVALVLVPASLSGSLASIPMEQVASVVPIPDGARAVVHTGSIVMGGESLADPASADAVLVVTGTLALSSPVEQVAYQAVIVTGLVLAPYGSEAALGAGLTRVTGSVHYFRQAEGQRIKTLSGQLTIGPDTLANAGGSPDDVLVVTGQIVVTAPASELGFQRVIGAGQLLLPRASEGTLAPALSADGHIVWYGGERVRVFIGDERLGRGFFELLDEPLALVLVGDVVIEDDVPPTLLREKVTEITLVGTLTASREVVPVLQLLTTEKHGDITTQDDGAPR